jgi:hypothetical protein
MSKKHWGIFSLVIVLSIIGTGCSVAEKGTFNKKNTTVNTNNTNDPNLDFPFPVISVVPQSIKEGKILVANVITDQDSWLVIHKENNRNVEEGEVVGYAPLSRGNHKNVEVKVNLSDQSTMALVAMLHIDEGKKGVFEFPGKDIPMISPLTSQSDIPVMMPFVVISKTKSE